MQISALPFTKLESSTDIEYVADFAIAHNNGMALTLKLICFTSSKKHKRPYRNGVDMEKGKVIFENYCSICMHLFYS